MTLGMPVMHTHDYKRQGTTTLFAALDMATVGEDRGAGRVARYALKPKVEALVYRGRHWPYCQGNAGRSGTARAKLVLISLTSWAKASW